MSAETPLSIRATRGWRSLGLRELWASRELLGFFVWREISSRYRQMLLGPLWLCLTPLLNMLLYWLVFGVLLAVQTEGKAPYPIFVLVALLPWQLFQVSANKSATSLVMNMQTLTKVYFPRLTLPAAAAGAGLVDFAAACIPLAAMMIIFRIPPGWEALALPLFAAVAMMTGLAVGLWLACLAVRFRDVVYGIEVLLRVWFFLTPVVYPASAIQRMPEWMQMLYRLNPMVGVIEGFRWSLLGQSSGRPGAEFWISCALAAAALISGACVFRRTERTIVDRL